MNAAGCAALCFACATVAAPSVAQHVIQAQAEYQPLTYTDDKGYKGCGIRASVLFESPPWGMEGAEISVNVWTRPTVLGLVKVTGLKAKIENGRPDIQKLQPAKFSLSTEKHGVPLKLLDVQPGEDPGYLIGGSDAEATLEIMMAMLTGERVVIGLTAPGDKGERRLVFAAELSPDDLKAMQACTDKAFSGP